MWKITTYMMLAFVPVFIVLIVHALQDLLDYKTGYSLHVKDMVEVPMPSFTICPYHATKNKLTSEQSFRALNYGSGTDLPMKLTAIVGKNIV